MLEKLKSLILNDQIFYSALIVLVAGISFWLGRLSLAPAEPPTSRVEVKIPQSTYKPEPTLTSASQKPSPELIEDVTKETAVIGSRTGDKYHLPTCPGAKQIKPENVVKFSSITAATAAGYKPAANCPQLQ